MGKKGSEKNPSNGDSPYLPWLIAVAAIGVLLLFVLRRSLLKLFPIFIVVAVFVPLILYCYRRHKYRDLENVYDEYSSLRALLADQRRTSYISLVDRSMANMLAARDKVENIRSMVSEESFEECLTQIKNLKKQIAEENDESRLAILERNLEETESNYASIGKVKEFLNKYENSKVLLAGHFKNLRIKIQMSAIATEAISEGNVDELDRIVSDIESVNAIYERVDKVCE